MLLSWKWASTRWAPWSCAINSNSLLRGEMVLVERLARGESRGAGGRGAAKGGGAVGRAAREVGVVVRGAALAQCVTQLWRRAVVVQLRQRDIVERRRAVFPIDAACTEECFAPLEYAPSIFYDTSLIFLCFWQKYAKHDKNMNFVKKSFYSPISMTKTLKCVLNDKK